MICCDYCSIWYHAHCVGLKKGEVDCIEKYACKECQKHGKKIVFSKSVDKEAKKKLADKIEKKIKKEPKAGKNEDKIIKVKKEKEGEPSTKKMKKNSTTSNPGYFLRQLEIIICKILKILQ